MESFQIFGKFLWPETWHLRHWLHFWQLRTTIWTITLWPLNTEWWWQHSQFLRCLFRLKPTLWTVWGYVVCIEIRLEHGQQNSSGIWELWDLRCTRYTSEWSPKIPNSVFETVLKCNARTSDMSDQPYMQVVQYIPSKKT